MHFVGISVEVMSTQHATPTPHDAWRLAADSGSNSQALGILVAHSPVISVLTTFSRLTWSRFSKSLVDQGTGVQPRSFQIHLSFTPLE